MWILFRTVEPRFWGGFCGELLCPGERAGKRHREGQKGEREGLEVEWILAFSSQNCQNSEVTPFGASHPE